MRCSEPFATISIKPDIAIRTHSFALTSTRYPTSTNAGLLRTRPACLSPSLRESGAREQPPTTRLKVQHRLSSRRLPPGYHGPLHGPPSSAGTRRRRRKGLQPTSRSYHSLTQSSKGEGCNIIFDELHALYAYACTCTCSHMHMYTALDSIVPMTVDHSV